MTLRLLMIVRIIRFCSSRSPSTAPRRRGRRRCHAAIPRSRSIMFCANLLNTAGSAPCGMGRKPLNSAVMSNDPDVLATGDDGCPGSTGRPCAVGPRRSDPRPARLPAPRRCRGTAARPGSGSGLPVGRPRSAFRRRATVKVTSAVPVGCSSMSTTLPTWTPRTRTSLLARRPNTSLNSALGVSPCRPQPAVDCLDDGVQGEDRHCGHHQRRRIALTGCAHDAPPARQQLAQRVATAGTISRFTLDIERGPARLPVGVGRRPRNGGSAG